MSARKTSRNSWYFNKQRRWSHSSRVKLPFVNASASWSLVSTYLIWIFGSKLILSNNQSSATLWVLDTCLIVGLLPLMIISSTASLSSNTSNKASWCENWTFECGVSCLSITVRYSRNDVQYFGSRHLWRKWALFSKDEHRLGSRFFTLSPRSRTRPWYFWNFGSNSTFLGSMYQSGLYFCLVVLPE